LAKLPDETVIDGELAAFDQQGRPSFNALQNTGSSPAPVLYYIFDVMVLAGVDLTSDPLRARLKLLKKKVLPTLSEPVRFAGTLDAPLADLVASVKAKSHTKSPGMTTCGSTPTFAAKPFPLTVTTDGHGWVDDPSPTSPPISRQDIHLVVCTIRLKRSFR
jgi:hypothetical protein